MSRLTKRNGNNAISKAETLRGGNCPQVPAFSFAYLTTNNTYNLNYFSDDNDKRTAITNIHERLLEICQNNWRHWHLLPRQQGLEMIPSDGVNFSPSVKKMMPDEKILVFRMKGYAGNGARILGIREDSCPIYYIIGYDFNFSAYDHG